jgi:superfamily I DNA/RNA helicase
MHRANHLASKVFTGPNDRILVTTFTRNLALDLRHNLKNLCGDAFDRLEVTNLHNWTADFMRRQGHPFRFVPEPERQRLFEAAVNEAGDDSLSVAFYADEWDRVVQAQDIKDRDFYLTAPRVGRGVRLTRKQRADIWKVFERYRALLDDNNWVEWQDGIRETRLYVEKQNVRLPYKAVLADEVQDFTANELRLLRAMAPQGPNSLFLVGDGHQRIYGQVTRLSSCGIDVRGRSRRLRVNYRTTEQIRKMAIAILEDKEIDDLDGGRDTLRGYVSLRHGPKPVIRHFAKEGEEAEFIVAELREW